MPLGFDKLGSRGRRWLGRIAYAVLLGVVALLIARKAAEIEWRNVVQAFTDYGALAFGAALLLSLPGQLACASFDLIGRRVTGHGLPVRRVMPISYAGYYFSLNLGALIGGLAFRYRLYVPYELRAMTIGQVILLSVVTNWSGYVIVAGAALAIDPPALPFTWWPDPGLQRGLGAVLLAVAAAYIGGSAWLGGRTLRLRGTTLSVPTPRIALAQLALSMLSWLSLAAVLAAFLPDSIGLSSVLIVVMVSAIVGVLSHVPGGLGVIEFVAVTLLGGAVPETRVLAAVLAFRIVCYLLPLAVAVALFLYLELTAKRRSAEPRARPTESTEQ